MALANQKETISMGTIIREKKKTRTSFRAEVRREGKRFTKRFKRRVDAKAWISDTETKLSKGERVPRLMAHTVTDAIDKYLEEVLPMKMASTQDLQRPQLEWVKKQIGSIKLYQLTSADLSKMRETLRSEGYVKKEEGTLQYRTPSTLNRYFQPLMHCLRTARDEWEWLQDVPRIKKLKENPARTKYFTPEEIRSVLQRIEDSAAKHLDVEKRKDRQFSERMNLMIARLALHTGARLSETCALRWVNIDLLDGIIRFHGETTKTGYDREIAISESLKADLAIWKKHCLAYPKFADSEFLFPAMRLSTKGYRSDFASKVFRKAATDLKIIGKTFHDIRHTTATWATKQGIPTRTVQSLLGHQKIATTQRYSHMMIDGQREAVEAIDTMLEKKSQETKDEKIIQ